MSTANIEQMRDAVKEMDCMAQAAFSEISTFAKLALGLMETPSSYEDPQPPRTNCNTTHPLAARSGHDPLASPIEGGRFPTPTVQLKTSA